MVFCLDNNIELFLCVHSWVFRGSSGPMLKLLSTILFSFVLLKLESGFTSFLATHLCLGRQMLTNGVTFTVGVQTCIEVRLEQVMFPVSCFLTQALPAVVTPLSRWGY